MPRMHWLVGLALMICPSPGFAAPATPQPSAGCSVAAIDGGRRLERVIDVDGVQRSYILDVPETIQPQQPVPLLFDFHGFGHSGAGVWQVSKFRDIAPQARFITVYPEGLPVHLLNRDGAGWQIFSRDGNRDLRFVSTLLDHLERTYCIDRARVYSTGFSNGAFLSNVLACSMADRFAAIAPVAGGRATIPCTPSRAMPVILHHGSDDPVVAVSQAREMRDTWVKLDDCHETTSADGCEVHRACRDGVEVWYCEDSGEHHWPVAATTRIWSFLSRYSLPAPPQQQ